MASAWRTASSTAGVMSSGLPDPMPATMIFPFIPMKLSNLGAKILRIGEITKRFWKINAV